MCKSIAFYDGSLLGRPGFGPLDYEKCAVPRQHKTRSRLLTLGGFVLRPLLDNVRLDHAAILHFKASLFVH